MKLVKYLLTAMVFLAFNAIQAQVNPTTGRIKPPDWGVAGHDNATYYYIPAAETYYDIKRSEYVYLSDGKWVRTNTLPTAYQDYDLYSGYKVILTDMKEPFSGYNTLREKYPKTYQGELQMAIKPRKQ